MGKICTFFGHRDIMIDSDLEERLENIIRDLIKYQGVDEFWLGGYSRFDDTANSILQRLKKTEYPHIHLCFMVAYVPSSNTVDWYNQNYDSLFCPLEADFVPKRFAISRRNCYMADHADYMVCFVDRKCGGAYRAVRRAIRQGKKVYNIAEKK